MHNNNISFNFCSTYLRNGITANAQTPTFDGPIIPFPDSGLQYPSEAPTEASLKAIPGTCMTSYTNGAGENLLEWCFDENGAVVQLEHPEGLEHVDNGAILEGWCVSAGNIVRGMVNGGDGTTDLDPPQYPSPDKVRHNTADGSLRIESRFSTSPGNKHIVVKMNVRNNTNAPLNDVFLTRFIDADMSNTTSNDEWTSTGRSVIVHQPGSASLQLFGKTRDYLALSMLYPTFFPTFDANCYDAAADANLSLTAGDRSMGVMYQLGTIFPGSTRTVQFLYRISD